MTEAEPPTLPTWVKILLAAGIVVLIAVIVVLLTASGHGPGRHGA